PRPRRTPFTDHPMYLANTNLTRWDTATKSWTRVPGRRGRSKHKPLQTPPRVDRAGPGEVVVMRVETQLSAFLENRAGALGRLAADLAKHGIGIRALTIANLADHAVVRLVVSDAHKALHLLGDRGVLVVTSDVLAIEVPDEAGALAEVARRLARGGVNIDY